MAIKNLEKMDIYNPTNYVNNSEPDIDADNLNKTENKLEETVAKANEIIDALKTLISTVQTNSDNTVPSSSLAYAMQQEITKNKEDIATANSNLGEHFSEAERQIGTWMGKPLYRQCFHPTVDIAAGTQSYNISLGLSGVEVAMIDYAHTWCMGRSNTDVYCIPYVHNDAVNNVGAFLIVENADVKFAIRKGTNTSIRSIWITLTYTKTTDS